MCLFAFVFDLRCSQKTNTKRQISGGKFRPKCNLSPSARPKLNCCPQFGSSPSVGIQHDTCDVVRVAVAVQCRLSHRIAAATSHRVQALIAFAVRTSSCAFKSFAGGGLVVVESQESRLHAILIRARVHM